MKHLLRTAWPVALAVAALALTLAVDGPGVLALDGHPLQRATAALLFFLGVRAHRLDLPSFERTVLMFGGVWLATDELLTIHECVHWSLKTRVDVLVIAYGLIGALVVAWLAHRFGWRRLLQPFVFLALFGALAAVLADTLHLGHDAERWLLVVEEAGELLAGSAALSALQLLPQRSHAQWLDWVVALACAALLACIVLPLRPLWCPPQFLR